MENLITKFYTAFQKKDFGSMQECYAAGATFTDSVFINLNEMEVKAMWHMLALGAKDLELQFNSVKATETSATCNWIARYTFSLTKRKVVNRIRAEFEFKDAKIYIHKDKFRFYSWARQAFGITGLVIGWTPFFRKKVQAASRKRLDDFMAQHKEYLQQR